MRLIAATPALARSRTMTHVQPNLSQAWLPVAFGLLVISLESTQVMGSTHTMAWLMNVCSALWGQTYNARFDEVHHLLRKTGHFTGYGLLGLFAAKAWTSTLRTVRGMRRRTRLVAGSAAGVITAAVVASMDEIHQFMIPGRTGTFHDVVLDTCGAAVFASTMYFIAKRRRHAQIGSAVA